MANYQLNISMDESMRGDVHQVADEIWAKYAEVFNADRGHFYMRVVEVKAGGLFGFNTGWKPEAGWRAAAQNLLVLRKK